jgi:hypothetical protein
VPSTRNTSYLEEVEQEEAAEPSEYEDPTVLEEDDWAAFSVVEGAACRGERTIRRASYGRGRLPPK